MVTEFETAGASVVGRDHLQNFLWKNNQDALCIKVGWPTRGKRAIVAVVSDGCGEGAYSEVGARLVSKILSEYLAELFNGMNESNTSACDIPGLINSLLAMGLNRVNETLAVLIKYMSDEEKDVILQHFLCTAVVAVVSEPYTIIASIGDGVYAYNGEFFTIGPFPNNAPPYVAYGGLIKSSIDPKFTSFQIHKLVKTSEVESVMIGSDGVGDLIKIEKEKLPGKNDLVGPLSQFWENDAYFKNPDALRRKLALINNSSARPDWQNKEMVYFNGHLKDDTTLAVIRRKKKGEPV